MLIVMWEGYYVCIEVFVKVLSALLIDDSDHDNTSAVANTCIASAYIHRKSRREGVRSS